MYIFSDKLDSKYLSQLIEGLYQAHQCGWYHHDIRPSNVILVNNDNNNNNNTKEYFRAILIDWGNATSTTPIHEENFHGTLACSASSILRARNRGGKFNFHLFIFF